jgi:hypothetical protein
MKKVILFLLILAVVVGLSLPANATLIDRGTDIKKEYQLIYDTDLDITWLESKYLIGYFSDWKSALAMVDSLKIAYNKNAIYDDWRLPTTVDGTIVDGYDGTTTAGFNITSSEMGHLFYEELGNVAPVTKAGTTQPKTKTGPGLRNIYPFLYLRPQAYWSNTLHYVSPKESKEDSAWFFNFEDGSQSVTRLGYKFPVLAVRDGDVAAASVPEPGMFFLVGTGLMGLIILRKRFSK